MSVTASEHSSLLSFPFCIWFWISSSVCPLNSVIVHTQSVYIWLCNSQNCVLLDFVSWASWYCLAQIRCSITAEFTNELMDQIGEDENLTQGNKARHSCRKFCDQDSSWNQLCTSQKAAPFWNVRRGIREGLGCSGERREGTNVLLQELDWFLASLLIYNR